MALAATIAHRLDLSELALILFELRLHHIELGGLANFYSVSSSLWLRYSLNLAVGFLLVRSNKRLLQLRQNDNENKCSAFNFTQYISEVLSAPLHHFSHIGDS